MSKDNGHEVVTQEEVAKHAGVSRSIVSYVLNNGPRNVSHETRTRVLAAIQELGYRPNQHAQRLKMGADAAQNSIGIVAGGKGYNLLQRPYYSLILASLFDRALHLQQHIRFFSFLDALTDPVFFNKNIHREEISSLIILLPGLILGDTVQEKILEQMIKRIDNVICLEKSVYDLPAIILDLSAAAEMAVEHLISLGHQRIGFLSLGDARLVGYRRALIMHGIPFDETLTRMLDGMNVMTSAYDLTIDLLQQNPDITALFAANDEAALAAMAALHDNGLKVPDDVAITSIDNTEVASIVRPALTTVNVPRREMAEYALQFLLSQREHRVSPAASMVLPIHLVVRDSSGAKLKST